MRIPKVVSLRQSGIKEGAMRSIQVQFRLGFCGRYDEEASVHVTYCPTLGIYSQGVTKEEAKAAIVSAAKLFIVRCYERDILHTALRARGMTKAIADGPANMPQDTEFISVGKSFTEYFEEDVPIQLLAAQEAATHCLQ